VPCLRGGAWEDSAVPSAGSSVADRVCRWYAEAARDLPWRHRGVHPWAVLVSEVMLQQTPVTRVLPAYEQWLARWPDPASLAAAPAGEAVRQWGRLGYPRRALALHRAAVVITQRHGGEVPRDLEELLALPGVGDYTARAVATFAFGQRHAVLDTNVRRVIARHRDGAGLPQGASTSAQERSAALALLPGADAAAARTSVALMELGALVCTARAPRCPSCPIAADCRWRATGAPLPAPLRRQTYAGTDRQARGSLLAVLRGAADPVPAGELATAWSDAEQCARALSGLIADGLVSETADGRYALPA
jgi:A/G-specific adenine glycosylase